MTGFGLLGHLSKLARASGFSAVVDRAAVPLIEGTRAAARAGHVPGGSRRNLQWVLPHTRALDHRVLVAPSRAARVPAGDL